MPRKAIVNIFSSYNNILMTACLLYTSPSPRDDL